MRDFVEQAFGHADLDWKRYVEADPRYFRPSEDHSLERDVPLARERLGWEAEVDFASPGRIMVEHDVAPARQEGVLRTSGRRVAVRGAASL